MISDKLETRNPKHQGVISDKLEEKQIENFYLAFSRFDADKSGIYSSTPADAPVEQKRREIACVLVAMHRVALH